MSVYKQYNYTLTVNGRHKVNFVSYYNYNDPVEKEEVVTTARQVAANKNLTGMMTIKERRR